MKDKTLIVGAVLLGAMLLTSRRANAATVGTTTAPRVSGTAPMRTSAVPAVIGAASQVPWGKLWNSITSGLSIQQNTSASGDDMGPSRTPWQDDLKAFARGDFASYWSKANANEANAAARLDDMPSLTSGVTFGGVSPGYSWDGLTIGNAQDGIADSLGGNWA